jgi:AbiV family abortive infection protein
MPSKELPSFDRGLLSVLARGAQKTFDNANSLYREAKLLGAASALGRALFLHQISLEECAKIETMGAWATSLLAGYTLDENKILAGFASHARKNRTNAYMLSGSAEEQAAKERGDWNAAGEEFKKLQAEFHKKSNDAKNASLYVDFEDGKFVAPIERITKDMLDDTADRNETFLGLTYPKLEMVLKWDKAPEEAQDAIVAFVELAEAMKAEKPDDAMAAFNKLIGDFVEIERAKRAVKLSKGERDAEEAVGTSDPH